MRDIAEALGHMRSVVFNKCVSVSGERTYYDDARRFEQVYQKERSIPMRHKTLEETLNPQPAASRVLMKLLGWIDRADVASQCDFPRPPFLAQDGSSIFPADDEPDGRWWLTELSKHKEDEKLLKDLEECAGSSEEDLSDEVAGDIVDDKKAHEETSDSESDGAEDTLVSNSPSKALLPLDRLGHQSRRSYEATPPSQASQ